jgi:Tol biopolymer transport system component
MRKTALLSASLAIAMLLACVVALVVVMDTPAHAAFPGKNGKIAFSNYGDLRVVNPDGSGHASVLAATPSEHVSDYDPEWSPNGRKIVSVSDPAGCCECCEIYVTNVSDSQRTRLTNTPEGEYGYRIVGSPTWSPSGRKIAFVSLHDRKNPDDHRTDIWVMKADGSGKTNITDTLTSEGAPAWSPDGKRIAFVRYTGPDELPRANIYVMNPNGTGETKLTSAGTSGTALSWSPDGTKVAFTRGYEIYTMRADGTHQRKIATSKLYHPISTWSPDGTKIAFSTLRSVSCGDCSSVYDIIVVNANGTGRTNITRSLWDGAGHPHWGPLDNTKAPKVSNMEPRDLATAVPPTANIVATFSKAMNPAKVNTVTLTLRRQDTDQLVPAQVEYLPATREAILDPEDTLLPGTTYIAIVGGGADGVLDMTLNPMASDEVWSFTVSG